MNVQTDELLKLVEFKLKAMGIDSFHPKVANSKKWSQWITSFSFATCLMCASKNGRIIDDKAEEKPPVHQNCACYIKKLKSIIAGTATIEGYRGAERWLKIFGVLPTKYITKNVAEEKGWKSYLGNLHQVCPGAVLGGDMYSNRSQKLPKAYNRLWYEADINYTGGYRNEQRVLFSNDGLIFVTYDHYNTFYEIV